MLKVGSSSRLFPSVLAGVLLGLLFTQGLSAQVDTGAILGTVKDQSGAVVPGAKVTVTNEGTSAALSKETGADGTYVFTPLRIGTYSVTAEFPGFQKAQRNHLTLDLQQQAVIDFSMMPGAVTQTIEVTAAAPLLQTTNGSVGNVVSGQAINNLSLNGRNFTFLAQTVTGVTIGQQDGRGLGASGSFSANGNRPAQNNYLLDGIDNNIDLVDFLNGTAFVVLPSVDAISEFKIQTTDYSAEIGRAGGAVLNATIKSGTNNFHGDLWEFVRNDIFDANDFFVNAAGQKRPEYRLNQFGFTAGGPILIPHVYDGRNKTFIFGDLEFTRRRQGTTFTNTVPTAAERASGYTNFRDLLSLQKCDKGNDLFGRKIACGTIFDPATTRSVTKGQIDPVTGLTATDNGFVRDQISCNNIPNTLCANRLDSNAIKLLNLYPAPTNSNALSDNFTTSPVVRDDVKRFDIRVDHNFSDKDQMFARFSYFDEPQFKPGPFGGIADGGGFNQGNQTAGSSNSALSWTHAFSPTLINEARFGFGYIHTGRLQPNGNTLGIPAQFGIPGVAQSPQNGGLPEINVGALSRIGSNAFLVSDEYNSTSQLTENLTKIYHSHTFKGGAEFQHIKFSTLQPPWSRGSMGFGGTYTSMPDKGDNTTGIAQLLLLPVNPVTAGTPNGVNAMQGGANDTRISNLANVDNGHNYYGGYFQDDWKVSPKLTLNLGLRWDYFAQVEENFGAQANFVPGPPGAGAKYLIPIHRKSDALSPSFTTLLAQNGINLVYTDNTGLGTSQKTNFSPRLGFAYRATEKLVVRGGYGIFYGGFENRGFSPNLGENYPFQFDFHFNNTNDWTPNTYADGSVATLEQGFLSVPLAPTSVLANGLALRGIQYDYITPYTQGFNLTLQYQLTPNQTFSIGYVGSLARHLETFPGSNQVSEILPINTCTKRPCAKGQVPHVPFPDFNQGSNYAATEGSSAYHSLQATFERRFSAGLNFNANYTFGKTRTDARDLLNGNIGGWRAPYLPGFGIVKDYALADFDVRNVVHFSGGWELPVGHGKHWLTDGGRLADGILGGWSTHANLVLQDGQPFTVGCIRGTNSGLGCNALLVPGQNIIGGLHNVDQWMNPAAFTQPCQLGDTGPIAGSPPGCAPATGFGVLGGAYTQLVGPGYHKLDWSLFKQIRTSERTHLEARFEFFNLTNHPNFALPSKRDFQKTDLKNSDRFGRITSTRDNPNDPREIQFALKFYW